VSDKRSLSGVKLIIADEHKGLKAAADKRNARPDGRGQLRSLLKIDQLDIV